MVLITLSGFGGAGKCTDEAASVTCAGLKLWRKRPKAQKIPSAQGESKLGDIFLVRRLKVS